MGSDGRLKISGSDERIMGVSLPKVVLVGNANAGKTSLLNRARFSAVEQAPSTVSVGTCYLDILVPAESRRESWKMRLQVWDSPGMEQYRSLAVIILRDARGVMFVYDVTCRESFEALPDWFGEVRQHVHPSCVCVMVANKIDLPRRVVQCHEGEQCAGAENMAHLEASALTGDGVDAIFLHLAKGILAGAGPHTVTRRELPIGDGSEATGSKCCR